MAQVDISQQDVASARQFMVDYLAATGEFNDVDFAPGSVHHDRVIRPLAFLFAYLQSEAARLEALVDLRKVLLIEDDTERNEAIDAFASNLFASRTLGRNSRGTALLHFSAPTTGLIPTGTRLIGSSGKAYVLDSDNPLFFAETDLVRQLAAGSTQQTWALSVPIVAAGVGPTWDAPPGRFSAVSAVNSLLLYAESVEAITGGTSDETADAFAARIPELLTLRVLVSPRAITTVLTETFSELRRMQTIGAGDPEMVRDILPAVSGTAGVHLGGYGDIYVHTSRQFRQARILVGASYDDTAPLLRRFTDWDLVYRGADLRALVAPGAILRFYDAQADESPRYIVRHVDADHLRISESLPFRRLRPLPLHTDPALADVATGLVRYTSVAFDGVDTFVLPSGTSRFVAADAPTGYVYVVDGDVSLLLRILAVTGIGVGGYGTRVQVSIDATDAAALSTTGLILEAYSARLRYSVGTNAPQYDDMIPVRDFGRVTRSGAVRGAVPLPEGPVYRIREINIDDSTSPLVDPFTGLVRLESRVNTLPDESDPQPVYKVTVADPLWAQSNRTRQLIEVGTTSSRGGTRGILTPDGFDADLCQLYDPEAAWVDPDDVGLSVLVLQPENIGNGCLFVVETVVTPTLVEMRRTSGSVAGAAMAFERNVAWRVDATAQFNGASAQVLYETLSGFTPLQDTFDSDDTRVLCAYMLVRGFYPVLLSMEILYQLKPTATSAIDEAAATRALVEFVNTFPRTDTLNVDDITTYLRELYPAIGNVFRRNPELVAYYELHSPSGDVVRFSSADAIVVSTATAATTQDAALYAEAVAGGVSDRTVYVLTSPDLITLTRVP